MGVEGAYEMTDAVFVFDAGEGISVGVRVEKWEVLTWELVCLCRRREDR